MLEADSSSSDWSSSYDMSSSSYNMTADMSDWSNMTAGFYVNWTFVDNVVMEIDAATDLYDLESIFNNTAHLEALPEEADAMFEDVMELFKPVESYYEFLNDTCYDLMWSEMVASDYTAELDWDACNMVDYDEMYADLATWDRIWFAFEDMVNGTDSSSDWSSSYNMTNMTASYNWADSYNMTNMSLSNMTNGMFVNWTMVEDFDHEISAVQYLWDFVNIYNDT